MWPTVFELIFLLFFITTVYFVDFSVVKPCTQFLYRRHSRFFVVISWNRTISSARLVNEMPKRKRASSAGPKAKSGQRRREMAPYLQQVVTLYGQEFPRRKQTKFFFTSGPNPAPSMTTTLTPEQQQEVTDRVAVLVRKLLGTPKSGTSLAVLRGDTIFTNSGSSYYNNLGHNVSTKIKIKIANDQYFNFGWLL